MTTINAKTAESLLRRAVRDRGEDTIGVVKHGSGTTCQYRKKGAPVCIVGQVISYVTDEPLGRVFPKELNNNEIYDEQLLKHLSKFDINFTDKAVELLTEAQTEQDNGLTWGEVKSTVLRKR